MELAQELVTLSTNVHTIASRLMNFQDDLLHLSDDYQHQVVILNSRLQSYQAQVRLHGQPANSIMMIILRKAEDTLQRVESRLQRMNDITNSNQCCHCCDHIRWVYSRVSLYFFPENVEKILKKVNDDIDNLLKVLKEEAEMYVQLQEASKREATPTLIQNNDHLYVPIEETQSAILAAIEDTQGPDIILLHGGVGRGKSTLARYVIHRYGQDRQNGGQAGSSAKKNTFEHVILVFCANCSREDATNKQFAILQELSPSNILGDIEPDVISGRIFARALQNFLQDKKVLLVLDDVTDATFLYEMWDSTCRTRQIKYLVTSQWANICNSLKSHSILIHMADPTTDEALQILASLVGLEFIPNNLQGIARKMIEEAEKNPLALACLASHFAYSDGNDKTDVRAWQDAFSELDKLLSSTEEKIVLGSTPRSLWAAMKLCIDSLDTKDARKILFLMYGCKGDSVPEALLRILHARIKTSSSTFMKSRNELVMRELLNPAVKSTAKDNGDGESRSWSLRSLVKLYMEQQMAKGEEMEKEMRCLIGELVGDKELKAKPRVQTKEGIGSEMNEIGDREARVALVLCALYFDPSLTGIHEIVVKALTEASIPYSCESFSDIKRQALEPIIQLLDKPADEYWKESHVHCVREVLLTYTCRQQLDDQHISVLLRLESCPFAQLATLKAIGQICLTEKSQLLSKNSHNFLQAIIHIMDYNHGLPNAVQEGAFKTFREVCWKAGQEESTLLIITVPGVLEVLIKALRFAPDEHKDLMVENAVHALWNLSYHPIPSSSASSNVEQTIISKEGILLSLVQNLRMRNAPRVLSATAGALANLATSTDTSTKFIIAKQDGALAGLVKLLRADDKPEVQQHAARALANLAATEDASLKVLIANEEGAVAGLVYCLGRDGHPSVQKFASRTLAKIVNSTDTSTKLIIAKQDGALAGLVKLLRADDKPEAQHYAAAALQNLADGGDASLKVLIANEEGAVAGLGHCLAVADSPHLQNHAAWVLTYLAMSKEANALLRKSEGLLAGLSLLLAYGVQPKTQSFAAHAMTLINPPQAKDVTLISRDAYRGRANGFYDMEMYAEALLDLDKAVDVHGANFILLSERCLTKTKLGDFKGAVKDANEAVKVFEGSVTPFALQERGILKRIAGDLEGSLADLNEGLKLETDDYERLKHRGYVRYLLYDKDGAHADAEWALRIKSPRVDYHDYEKHFCLGVLPVEYLGYKLK